MMNSAPKNMVADKQRKDNLGEAVDKVNSLLLFLQQQKLHLQDVNQFNNRKKRKKRGEYC